MRFGQNAKKIKNKVAANIIKDVDLSAKETRLNEMIREFEKKMADLELNRTDQENWHENYTRMQLLMESITAERDTLGQRLL